MDHMADRMVSAVAVSSAKGHCMSWQRKGMRCCQPVRTTSASHSRLGELGPPANQAPALGT